MPVILFESPGTDLAPLDSLRFQGDIPCGAFTLAERAERLLGVTAGRVGRPRAGGVSLDLPAVTPGPGLYIAANLLLLAPLAIEGPTEVGTVDGRIAWLRLDSAGAARLLAAGHGGADVDAAAAGLPRRDFSGAAFIDRPWDVVRHLPSLLAADAAAIEPRRSDSARIHATAVLDESTGPIVVGEGAVIEPLAVIAGPAIIGPGAVVKAHAHIRGSVIGRGARVGGEISASIFFPFSNKQHDGFIGHSVVGSWVNIGAGTTGSNLKNTYGEIRVDGEPTGLQYLGQIIGDHTKIGIQGVMNTGSVYGVCSCLVTAGKPFPRRIGDFDFAGKKAEIDAVIRTARIVMARRGHDLTATTEALFRALHEAASAPQADPETSTGGTPRA